MNNSFGLVTYNLLACTQPELLLSTVVKLKDQTDVICLQEVVAHKGISLFLQTLTQVLGPSWRIESFFDADAENDLGLIIACKHTTFTFLSRHELFLPQVQHYSLIELLIKSLVGLSQYILKRKALSIILSYKGKLINIVTLHLSLEGGTKQRLHQLRYIQQHIKNNTRYKIVCGDFNTLHFDGKLPQEQEKIQEILSGFTDTTKHIPVTADATQYTYPTLLNQLVYGVIHFFTIHLYQKLDYIWTKGLQHQEVQAIRIPGSDHFPIIAQFELES